MPDFDIAGTNPHGHPCQSPAALPITHLTGGVIEVDRDKAEAMRVQMLAQLQPIGISVERLCIDLANRCRRHMTQWHRLRNKLLARIHERVEPARECFGRVGSRIVAECKVRCADLCDDAGRCGRRCYARCVLREEGEIGAVEVAAPAPAMPETTYPISTEVAAPGPAPVPVDQPDIPAPALDVPVIVPTVV